MSIPLYIPNIGPLERQRVDEALQSGWVSTAGPQVTEFEAAMCAYTGATHAIALNSGTAALHLALIAIGTQPGDQILVPNLTFAATLNAVSYTGAQPVLVDVEPGSLGMDPAHVERYLREECAFKEGKCHHKATGARVRAILPVHVLGYPCAITRLLDLARAHGLLLIEDAAAAIGCRLQGRHLGTFGLIGTLSFNGNKVLTTGGGGMVLTHDKRLADHVRHLASQAKSFPAEYIHDAIGYNYGMTAIAAALGLAQLERLPSFLQRKREIHATYKSTLTETLAKAGAQLHDPPIPDAELNHWLEVVFSPDAEKIIQALQKQGIDARKLWVPMNRLPMYAQAPYLSTEDHSHRAYLQGICLPSSSGLSEMHLQQVLHAAKDCF